MTTNARKVPYGWKIEAGKLVEDAAAQEVIADIMEQHRLRISQAMIAADLNARGIQTARGGRWHGSMIGKVIAANAVPEPPQAPAEAPTLKIPLLGKEAAIAAALEKDPNAKYFEWWEQMWDVKAGDWKSVWMKLNIEDSRRQDEELRIQVLALQNLTLSEKAERFRFYDPLRLSFADSINGIAKIVTEMTAKRGYDLQQLITEIKDQPREKALIRQHVNLLLREVAIQRQENLSLRQENAKKRDELAELRKVVERRG
jgi:hypothetical protein